MYSTFPPQEGNDPKLSDIIAPPTAAAPSAVAQQWPNNCSATKQPPQVGNDPKLLVCMNDDGDALESLSSTQHANLNVAASDPSHHQQQLSDAASPTQESIANSLLSFKQTSPISTARKAPPNANTCMVNFCPIQPNPAHSLTNSNQRQTIVDASIDKKPENNSHNHGMPSNVSCDSTDVAAEPCINNSNFWMQDEEERFL